MLELSLLDNGIKKKGQGQIKNQKQTNPPNTQTKTTTSPWPIGVRRWNKLRPSRQSTIPGSHHVSPLRYGMVGTVAGDGAPRSLSAGRSSGVCWTRPFSFSDSSLVGLRPFLLLLFHPARALCALFFCGSSLSLAVLAGLLPQLTTYDHCFTFVDFMQLHLVHNNICSKPIFTKLNRLSILVANRQTFILVRI